MALEINQVLQEKSLPCFSIPAIKDKVSASAWLLRPFGACAQVEFKLNFKLD